MHTSSKRSIDYVLCITCNNTVSFWLIIIFLQSLAVLLSQFFSHLWDGIFTPRGSFKQRHPHQWKKRMAIVISSCNSIEIFDRMQCICIKCCLTSKHAPSIGFACINAEWVSTHDTQISTSLLNTSVPLRVIGSLIVDADVVQVNVPVGGYGDRPCISVTGT